MLKPFSLAACLTIGLGVGSPAPGEAATAEQAHSASQMAGNKVFLEAGAGSSPLRVTTKNYFNREELPNYPNSFRTVDLGLSNFYGFLGAGIVFPDHLRWSLRGEWLREARALSANLQVPLFDFNFSRPYFQLGLSLDMDENDAIGPGGHLGFGTEFTPAEGLDLFIEARLHLAMVFYHHPQDKSQDYTNILAYFPLQGGVRFELF